MIVRELMKQLLDLNPDAEIKTVLNDGTSTNFSIGWKADDSDESEAHNSKMLTKEVSIFVNDSKEIIE